MNENNEMLIPEEVVMSKIYLIRGVKVMLDMDLAELYGVETKQLKRAVRRNLSRFPPDFMFELSETEFSNWRRQFGTSNKEKMGLRIPPFAFTEYGVLMLASVLNSERAIQVNIQIVRIFSKMREMILENREIIAKMKEIEHKLANHDDNILLIFEYLKQLELNKQQQDDQANRTRIGFCHLPAPPTHKMIYRPKHQQLTIKPSRQCSSPDLGEAGRGLFNKKFSYFY